MKAEGNPTHEWCGWLAWRRRDIRKQRQEAAGAVPSEQTMVKREQARIEARRAVYGMAPEGAQNWALALSGGGIRSATLGFGVMEGLATSAAPRCPEGAGKAREERGPMNSVLARFDYLSTVSGGGYIGAFFCSLFVPGRLDGREDADDEQRPQCTKSARSAYETMATVPPGRIRTSEGSKRTANQRRAIAWLRENGRYLAPRGAGDYIYGVAYGIRNWAAVHYVLGTVFLAVFSLLSLLRSLLAREGPQLCKTHLGHLCSIAEFKTAFDIGIRGGGLLWLLAAAVLFLWVLPTGLGFWLSYEGLEQSAEIRPKCFGLPPRLALGFAAFLGGAGLMLRSAGASVAGWMKLLPNADGLRDVAHFSLALALTTGLGVGFHVLNSVRATNVSGLRVRLTQLTASGLFCLVIITVIAVAATGGQWLYGSFLRKSPELNGADVAVVGALLGGLLLVWAIRSLAMRFDERAPARGVRRWPVGLIAGVGGGVILVVVAILWDSLVEAMTWLGQMPSPETLKSEWWHIGASSIVVLFVLALAITVGRFEGFSNLSTLQAIYAARLTRAYLGASNGERFAKDPLSWSAAQVHKGDQLSLKKYYEPGRGAPLHIINVTVNQTVDRADLLVQRDRKGKPLAVLPDGFSIDGQFHFEGDGQSEPENEAKGRGSGTGRDALDVGHWVGTSGAAVSTGLGRATTFGTSLALGLANVRLGLWWSSGVGKDESGRCEKLLMGAFRTQLLLVYELLGRFHGLHREWQYLSDGGHFDNTALYELVRPARKVRLIVACDHGCDPEYRFEDLANLIRLARIDFALEIEIDERIARCPELGEVFGTIEDIRSAPTSSDKCALLLNVYGSEPDEGRREPRARIIVVKPRVIGSASSDTVAYHRRHADFPQQPTANQFFDEAQWESYRDLGYRMAKRIFGARAEGGVGAQLWQFLAM